MRALTVAFLSFLLLLIFARSTTVVCGEDSTPGVKLEFSAFGDAGQLPENLPA